MRLGLPSRFESAAYSPSIPRRPAPYTQAISLLNTSLALLPLLPSETGDPPLPLRFHNFVSALFHSHSLHAYRSGPSLSAPHPALLPPHNSRATSLPADPLSL